MIEDEEMIRLLKAKIETMSAIAREASEKAIILERGLRNIVRHVELVGGKMTRISGICNIANGALIDAGRVKKAGGETRTHR